MSWSDKEHEKFAIGLCVGAAAMAVPTWTICYIYGKRSGKKIAETMIERLKVIRSSHYKIVEKVNDPLASQEDVLRQIGESNDFIDLILQQPFDT